MARSAKQRAASRANLIKARAARRRVSPNTKRRAKRVAKTAGVVGLVAAGGYGAHKASGSTYSKVRFDTIPGLPKSHYKTGVKVHNYKTHVVAQHIKGNKDNTHTIRTYSAGVNGVFGSKNRGAPEKVTQYKPPRARIRHGLFNTANYPHTEESLRANRALRGSPNKRYKHRLGPNRTGITEAEALRRANTYVGLRSVSGKKVSAAERDKALRRYRGQKI
jgi:hypothetical protein